jgi:hypothetical protein
MHSPSTTTRTALGAAVAAAALWAFAASPASAAMPGEAEMTAQSCQAERAEVGAKAFRKEYGKKPMRKCMRRTRAAVAVAVSDAYATCDEELALLGPAAFTEEYTDDTGRDPYTMCVEDYVWGELDYVDFD